MTSLTYPERPGHGRDSVLAGGVGRRGEHVPDTGDARRRGQVEHHATLAAVASSGLGHVLEGQLHAQVGALDVDVVEPLPMLLARDPGRVDQHVRHAEGGNALAEAG